MLIRFGKLYCLLIYMATALRIEESNVDLFRTGLKNVRKKPFKRLNAIRAKFSYQKKSHCK